jgi:heme-degrading monooxygenase HmoA
MPLTRRRRSARAWKNDPAHAAIREQGRAKWYDWYAMAIAEVTRSYGWQEPKSREL